MEKKHRQQQDHRWQRVFVSIFLAIPFNNNLHAERVSFNSFSELFYVHTLYLNDPIAQSPNILCINQTNIGFMLKQFSMIIIVCVTVTGTNSASEPSIHQSVLLAMYMFIAF